MPKRGGKKRWARFHSSELPRCCLCKDTWSITIEGTRIPCPACHTISTPSKPMEIRSGKMAAAGRDD